MHGSIVEALAVSNDIRHQHQLSLGKALYVTVHYQRLVRNLLTGTVSGTENTWFTCSRNCGAVNTGRNPNLSLKTLKAASMNLASVFPGNCMCHVQMSMLYAPLTDLD